MLKNRFSFPLLLLTIVSCIYVLRLTDASPSNFFQETLIRVLQETIEPPVNEPLCEGVTITPVSESQIQTSLEIRSHLSDIQSTNHLMEFIEGPEPKENLLSSYVGPLVGKSVQWIVFFGIGVVLLILCLLAFAWAWCAARYSLKHGKVIRVGRGVKLYMWMSIVFLVPLLGAAIATLIFTTTQVHTGVEKSLCAIAIFGDQIQYGDPEQHWIGTTPLVNQTLGAVAVLPATVQNLSYPTLTATSDRASVNRAFTTVSGSVTTFYQDNQGQTIDRADPAFTTPYIPTYIDNLGPPSNSSTESGQILAEMQQKRDVVVGASQNLTAAISALRLLALAPSVVQPILTQLVAAVIATAASVSSANSQLKEYAQDVSNIVDDLVTAMVVVFSVNIGFVVVALLAIALLCIGFKWPRRFLHFSWCVIGLLMTFTWVLATFFWMSALVVNDICGVADAILVDPAVYNATVEKFFPEPQYALSTAIVYNCFYGDGNVLGILGEAQDLAPFTVIFNALNNTANLTEAIQPVPDSIVIPAQQFEVSQIEVGFVSDDPLTDTDLANLNTFTHHDTNGCTQVEDTWILNSANCTDPLGTIFASSSSADFNVGNPTCIGFNNWGTKQIDVRYNTVTFPQPSCGLIEGDQADVGLTNYVDSFVTHQQNVAAVFGNVQTGLTDVATANANYMNTITAATANIAPIWNQTSQIYPFLGSPETGIIPNSNCAFLRSSFQIAEDQICVRLLPGIYRDMISLIVAAFMGLFALPFLFCFSKKLLQYRKQDKAVEMGRQGAGAYKTSR